jgi:hypothetical protein
MIPLMHLSEWCIRSMTKTDPLILNHTVSPDSKPTYATVPFDIEDPHRPELQDFYDNLTGSARTLNISNIDAQLADLTSQVKSRREARDFLLAFADDPRGFIKMWLESQAADLDESLEVNGKSRVLGASAEEMRRADFWKDGWVQDALNVYSARMAAGIRGQAQGQTQVQGGAGRK